MKRNQPQRNTQVHMHGWDDACKVDLSHDVTQLCINERRAVCSVMVLCTFMCATMSMLFIAFGSSMMLLCVKLYAVS